MKFSNKIFKKANVHNVLEKDVDNSNDHEVDNRNDHEVNATTHNPAKIFIGITTYNNLDNLENIKRIADSGHDYLVVDDYSTDGLVEALIANEMNYLQPSHKVGGPGKSRNMIIDYALKMDYSFITFCDGDDELDLEAIEKISRVIKEDDEYIFTQMLTRDNDTKIIPVNSSVEFSGRFSVEQLVQQPGYFKIFNSNGGRIYNLNLIKNNQLKYIDDQPGQDTHFNMLCYNHAQKYLILEDVYFYTRSIDENSMSNNFKFESFNQRTKTIRMLTKTESFAPKWKIQIRTWLSKIDKLSIPLAEKERLIDTLFEDYASRDLFPAKISKTNNSLDWELNFNFKEATGTKLGVITHKTNYNVIKSFENNEKVEVITYVSLSDIREKIYEIVQTSGISNVVYFSHDLKTVLSKEMIKMYVENANSSKLVIPNLINYYEDDVYNINKPVMKNEYSLVEHGIKGIDGIILPYKIFMYQDNQSENIFESNISMFIADYGKIQFNPKIKLLSYSFKEELYNLASHLSGNRKIIFDSYKMRDQAEFQMFFFDEIDFDFSEIIGFNKFTEEQKQYIKYSISITDIDLGFYVVNNRNEVISIYLKDRNTEEIDFSKLVCFPSESDDKYDLTSLIYTYKVTNLSNIIQGNLKEINNIQFDDLNHRIGRFYNVATIDPSTSNTKLGTLCFDGFNAQFIYNKDDLIIGSKFLVSKSEDAKLLKSKDYIYLNPCNFELESNPNIEVMFIDENDNIIKIGEVDCYLKLKIILITNGKIKISNSRLLKTRTRFNLDAESNSVETLKSIYVSDTLAYLLSDDIKIESTTTITSDMMPLFSKYFDVRSGTTTRPIIISTSFLNKKSISLENFISKINRIENNPKFNICVGLLVDDKYKLNVNKSALNFSFFIYKDKKTCYANEYLLSKKHDMLRFNAKYNLNVPVLVKASITSQQDLNRVVNFLEVQRNKTANKYIIMNKTANVEKFMLPPSNLIEIEYTTEKISCRPKYILDIDLDYQYDSNTIFEIEQNLLTSSKSVNDEGVPEINLNLETTGINKPVKYIGKSLAIFVRSFPNVENTYSNQFVFSRIKEYQKLGYHCEVFSNILGEYIYAGVKVNHLDTAENCKEVLSGFTNVHIHMMREDLLVATRLGLPVTMFSHGADAFSYHTREHNTLDLDFINIKGSLVNELRNKRNYMDAFTNSNGNCEIVFVSEWLKQEFMKHYKLDMIPSRISNNFVDADFFEYNEKDFSEIRFLTIKSFANHNYANDVLIDTISHLSTTYDRFNEMKFTIIGDGELFKTQTKAIQHLDNVTLKQCFLTREEIKAYHKAHNVGIYITRADTQGVSRNEATMSGLLTVSSAVQAIPEFSIKESHLIEKNEVDELAAKLIDIFENRSTHNDVVKKEREFLVNKLSHENTIYKDNETLLHF